MRASRFLLPILVVLASGSATAESEDRDQDRAREALRAGEIRPLGEVLATQPRALPGEVVGIELEREDGRWVYKLRILTEEGDRRELDLDARDLRVLEVE